LVFDFDGGSHCVRRESGILRLLFCLFLTKSSR
jgi:hypothetical protein